MKPKDKTFYKKTTLNIHGSILSLDVPHVMGILNITPDSFYSGSRYNDIKKIVATAEKMLAEGAKILDIGGCSTRPGASIITADEELERVMLPIKEIKKEFPEAIISIDTFRAEVASAAVDEGAGIINDVSGGEADEKMFATAGRLNVPYILMHSRGTSENMASLTDYENLLKEILLFFEHKITLLRGQNVKDIILDIGFGFAKTIQQNMELLHNLDYFDLLELPMLVGVSRKSTIYKTLGVLPDQALNGTTVLNTVAILNNANFLRVHDVKEAVEVIKLLKL